MPWFLHLRPDRPTCAIEPPLASSPASPTVAPAVSASGGAPLADCARNVTRGEVVARLDFVDDVTARALDPTLIFPDRVFPPFVNCVIDPADPGLLRASVSGWLRVTRRGVAVEETLTLEGDLDEATGVFSFVGDLVVQGDVLRGASVQARHVRVEGKVDGGVVRATRSVVVTGGVSGQPSQADRAGGLVEAGGDIRAAFCENGQLYAEGAVLVERQAVNVEIAAGQAVVARGDLRGGRIYARRGVRIDGSVGGRFDQDTVILLGYDPFLLRQAERIEAARLAVARRLGEVQRQELRGGEAATTGQKAEQALRTRLEALERKKADLWGLVESQGFDDRARLVVRGEIRPGVEVAIGPAFRRVEERLRAVVLEYDGGEVVERPVKPLSDRLQAEAEQAG